MDGPDVKIEMTTEREVMAVRNGQHIKIRVPTKSIDPGGTLIYAIHLLNQGNSPATNVVVNNPVPEGAVYVPGSAAGKGSKPLVSTDHGSTFSQERHLPSITPESVTDIRWVVDNMPAGSTRNLEFHVTVTMKDTATIARYWTAIYLWLLAMFSK